MTLVLAASSDPFSAQHTGTILLGILTALFGKVQPQTFDLIHFLVRKSAHFLEYAVLSALWFRAFRGAVAAGWHMRWAVAALAITLAVASLDEWHQSFVPSRGSSPRDVLLDLGGALCAQLVIWMALRARSRSRPAAA